MSFYKLLKKNAVIETTEEHAKALDVIKNDLMEATNVTLRLPKPGLQYVILCDAIPWCSFDTNGGILRK